MSDCSSPTSYPSDCDLTAQLRQRAATKHQGPKLPEALIARAKNVKLLLLDVDGVLTDGTLLFSHDGNESKGFNTQDGFGIRLLQEAGVKVGIITARHSEAVAKRAENLKLRYTYLGSSDKLSAYKDILGKSGLKPFEIGYMGDDWLDLVLLTRVGLAVAPANGVDEVKDIVHHVTDKQGGAGAVREVCDLILRAKGRHQELLQSYMNR